MLDSGATSHMTGSRSLMTEMRPNLNGQTVSYGDKSKSKVLGLGKVVVTPDVSLVNVLLVETLGYNLMSIAALAKTQYLRFRLVSIGDGVAITVWPQLRHQAFASGHMTCGTTIEHPF